MGDGKLIKIDASSLNLPEIVTSDLFKINTLSDRLSVIQQESERMMAMTYNEERLKEEREEENRLNLRATAERLDAVNEKLEEQIKQKNEDLQNQRKLIHMLEDQLHGISRTLSDLFILEEGNKELQEEAKELAKEIYASMIQNKKVDWKTIATDKGIDLTIASIPILLQLAKVI